MSRDQHFYDGVSWATKRCIQWLHNRADEMNDPHAKSVLNSAATNMGWDLRAGETLVRLAARPTTPGTGDGG